MESDAVREDRVCAALEAVLLLGMASGLDPEALLRCLAITTGNLLREQLVREHCLPDEIEAALRVYMHHLAGHVWAMIYDNDTSH
jgi:hypothetical protein